MRKAFGWIAAVCVALTLGAGLAGAAETKVLGAFKLKTLDGKEVTQETIRGKKTLFVVAQTACSQCQAELKAINERYDEIKEKAQVYVILVDMKSEVGAARYQEGGFRMPAVLDPKFSLPAQAGILVTPGTFIVDKDLKVVYTKTGFRPGTLESILQEL